MGKSEAFYRVVCGNKITRGKGHCDRWLGELEISKEGSIAGYFCRDCKTLHRVEVVSKGIVKRTIAPKQANLEYDPTVVVLS